MNAERIYFLTCNLESLLDVAGGARFELATIASAEPRSDPLSYPPTDIIDPRSTLFDQRLPRLVLEMISDQP